MIFIYTMKNQTLNEQVSRIKSVMGLLNEDTTTGLGYNDVGLNTKPATPAKPVGEKIPMPAAVPPADQAIANEILNNVKTQEALVKILPKIKNAQQFLNVSNGIKIASNNTTYDFFELASRYAASSSWANRLNGVKNNVATKQITDYLTKIGVNSKSYESGQIVFLGLTPKAIKKQTPKPKMNWVKETGKFPLMYGQVGPTIKSLQIALGLKGDTYFGPTTEKYILSKAPEYKRATGVTQDIYNKIVNATKPETQTTTTPPTETQLQANPSTLNPY